MPKRKACRIRLLPEAHLRGQERAVQAVQLPLQVAEEMFPAGTEGRQEGRVSNSPLRIHWCLDIRTSTVIETPSL